MSKSVLENIIPGNFDDDMSVLADVDWVVEAVVERLDIKKSILNKINEYTPPISLSQATLRLLMSTICADMDESFKARFFGTHFFNPPRYMKLLEIIPHWIQSRNGQRTF